MANHQLLPHHNDDVKHDDGVQVRVRGLEGVGEEASNRNQTLERERGETARYHHSHHHHHRKRKIKHNHIIVNIK